MHLTKTRFLVLSVALLLLFVGITPAALAQSDNVKLTPPILSGEGVVEFQISPDGATVVYRADRNRDEVFELYRVPLAGGASVRLTPPQAGLRNINDLFQISPDSTTVVYRAVQGTGFTFELYSVPLAGGPLVKLNPLLPSGGIVSEFQISPDGATVVYRADQDEDDVRELYRVPVGGGASVKLNPPLFGDRDVSSNFQISPDGATVVYRADQDKDGVDELYRVPLAGGASVRLNPPLFGNQDVSGGDFRISPDSTTVVYVADQDTEGVRELYSVPLAGGPSVKLNPTMPSGGDVFSDFQISPDGTTVVYRADQDTVFVTELYRVPIGGGPVIKLNPPLPSSDRSVDSTFQISPDSAAVVYVADQNTDDARRELHRVPLAGGPVIKLNPPLPSFGDVASTFRISPDGDVVVYLADRDMEFVFELYSVPLAGGASAKLNPPLGSDRRVAFNFRISPDGATVVYVADQDTDNVFELYSVSLDLRFDVNNDGFITPADVVFVLNRLGDDPNTPAGAAADVDDNGAINAADVDLIIGRLGQTLD